MKLNRILASALIGLPLLAFGRPATQEKIPYTNPDGTVTEIRVFGDEDFSYITDAKGLNVLEADASGFLRPAMRMGRTLTTSKSDIAILRAEVKPVQQEERGVVSKMAALDNGGRTTYPTTGDVPALVILVEYPDSPFTSADPQKQFTRLCNEEGYSDFGSRGSARDYYRNVSHDKFRPTFEVYGPVKLEHESAWYVDAGDPSLPGYGKSVRFGVAIQEAVKALDDQIDFSRYDLDGDGKVDNIFFFYSGYGQADTFDKTKIWPHQADFWRYTKVYVNTIGLDRLYADGKEIRTYACSNELNGSSKIASSDRPWIDGIGAFVHEYGHVLGLPDLYDTLDTGTVTPGHMDVMDLGSYNELSTCPPGLSAYEKWVCKWLEYEDAEEGQTYTLPAHSDSAEEGKAVRIRVRRPGGSARYSSEYFLVESRSRDNWDSSLPDAGLVFWRIAYDKLKWPDNTVNVSGKPCIQIVQPEEDLYFFPGEFEDYPFITPDSEYALVPYSYASTFNAWISNIKYDYDKKTGSFEYNKYTEYPTDATVLHDNPTVESKKRNIHLVWDALPGAVDYEVTIEAADAAGKMAPYFVYTDYSTAGGTSLVVTSVPEQYWTRKFQAKVRSILAFPSSAYSNVVEFVPANLEEWTAVDAVYEDASPIYGLRGSIVAPDNAKVYNLSGIETGKENLPAGIYIVNCDGKTVKVVVR